MKKIALAALLCFTTSTALAETSKPNIHFKEWSTGIYESGRRDIFVENKSNSNARITYNKTGLFNIVIKNKDPRFCQKLELVDHKTLVGKYLTINGSFNSDVFVYCTYSYKEIVVGFSGKDTVAIYNMLSNNIDLNVESFFGNFVFSHKGFNTAVEDYNKYYK